MTIYPRSLFNMENAHIFDLNDLKEKLSHVLINQDYPLNGGILDIVPYELGFLILSEGIMDIYTHKVLYSDVIDYAITNNRLPVSYGYSAQLIETESAVMHRNTLQFKNHFDVLLVV